MVKKLFKHEFMALARIMVFVYMILFTVALTGRAIQFFENDSIWYGILLAFTILSYLFTVVCVSAFFMGLSIVRFYKNLFTYEGYLSFTLPVTAAQQIGVKTAAVLCFDAITGVVIFLSACIMASGDLLTELWNAFAFLMAQWYTAAGFQMILLLLELFVLTVILSLFSILLYYTFIAIGQLFRKLRILASFGAYFAYSISMEFLYTIGYMLFVFFAMTPAFSKLMMLIVTYPYASAHIALWVSILFTLGCAILCFVVIRHIITKRLNLE